MWVRKSPDQDHRDPHSPTFKCFSGQNSLLEQLKPACPGGSGRSRSDLGSLTTFFRGCSSKACAAATAWFLSVPKEKNLCVGNNVLHIYDAFYAQTAVHHWWTESGRGHDSCPCCIRLHRAFTVFFTWWSSSLL